MPSDTIQRFIEIWSRSGGAERANYVSFLNALCDLLEVPRPDPTVPEDDDNAYVFERRVVFINPDGTQSFGRIDLYKRGCFVLETKQGIEKQDEEKLLSDAGQQRQRRRLRGHGTRGSSAWNDTLLRARGQAEQYARALTGKETRPPFLVVIDVGHTIDLYAEFTQTGGTYVAFPDPQTSRIRLDQLNDSDVRDRLRALWLDPLSLDPARRSVKVTREIANKLAELAKLFEAQKHDPHDVAQFLMRCLFTMFAEDVELLPKDGFRDMLKKLDDPAQFKPMAEDLWRQMNVGGFSAHFRKKLLRFNGGLFNDPSALAINRDQLDLLIEAAGKQWRDVEPAIFGTLLERALSTTERHKLGAHYTPRAYVERLVMPTIIEPIRKEWDSVRAAAIIHAQENKIEDARNVLDAFHRRLRETIVLDPACGTGNFLYVTMEHLKRIEGEIIAAYESFGVKRQVLIENVRMVDPHQFLGIEINPRAVAIADLVLWIGYLQWHYRTIGNVNPPEPIIKNFRNVKEADALLTWTSREPLLDNDGEPVTRWDGRTTKKHPATGEEVPDETAREISYKYNNPKKAVWPSADYVVGNPPFIGDKRMRTSLGTGYVDALRKVYKDVPQSADYVMFWWSKAADLVTSGDLRRFGLITTNSITQSFNQKLITKKGIGEQLSFVFAVPDHPWVDSADGAAVRIAMTAVAPRSVIGVLQTVESEIDSGADERDVILSSISGHIESDLRIATSTSRLVTLEANHGLAANGVGLYGQGFLLDQDEVKSFGDLRKRGLSEFIPPFIGGRDITDRTRDLSVIDLLGADINDIRKRFPDIYQRIVDRVKPERDQNNRESYRERWWVFGEPRANLRDSWRSVVRLIGTPRTAKHRMFTFLPKGVIPETEVIAIASDDPYTLGVLSSRVHVAWSLFTGTRLEDRPRYNSSRVFSTFPFPDATESKKSRIRELGEQLDAYRKRQQAQHPKLTMTGMYNVLEKLRAGEPLDKKEREIHEQGLVSVLQQIHDDLDAAVADAYGWPADLSDEEILSRLVALNHQRAEEERRGLIRWLRPDFQNPSGEKQTAIAVAEETTTPAAKQKATRLKKQKWPKTLSGQAGAVHAALANLPTGATAGEIDKLFLAPKPERIERIEEILETLESLGKARDLGDGRYVAM